MAPLNAGTSRQPPRRSARNAADAERFQIALRRWAEFISDRSSCARFALGLPSGPPGRRDALSARLQSVAVISDSGKPGVHAACEAVLSCAMSYFCCVIGVEARGSAVRMPAPPVASSLPPIAGMNRADLAQQRSRFERGYEDDEREMRRNYDYGGYGAHAPPVARDVRSDARIHEDVSDRLYVDHDLDASDIEVLVRDGRVTLEGQLDSARCRRRADDIAHAVPGVTEVYNHLRVGHSRR